MTQNLTRLNTKPYLTHPDPKLSVTLLDPSQFDPAQLGPKHEINFDLTQSDPNPKPDPNPKLIVTRLDPTRSDPNPI